MTPIECLRAIINAMDSYGCGYESSSDEFQAAIIAARNILAQQNEEATRVGEQQNSAEG